MPQVRDRDLAALADSLRHWQIVPDGSEGWRKAEVTLGGVDTRELDSQAMQSRRVPGLHFIGEVVDVTGWLGGYNFQWAWASAAACARALARAAAHPGAHSADARLVGRSNAGFFRPWRQSCPHHPAAQKVPEDS